MTTKLKQLNILMLLMVVFAACKKDKNDLPVLSSLNVVNATVGLPVIKMNTTGKPVDYATFTETINYGAAKLYAVASGNMNISAVASATPSQDLFNFNKEFKPGGLYSLYLIGQMPTVDTLYREDHFPLYTDSAIAVRVINLSPNSTSLNVTLSGTPLVDEFSNLGYKQQSEFKKYSAKTGVLNTAFNFQVRTADRTQVAIYNFTVPNLNASRFKSVTLVIRGLIGSTGANAPGLIFVGNY